MTTRSRKSDPNPDERSIILTEEWPILVNVNEWYVVAVAKSAGSSMRDGRTISDWSLEVWSKKKPLVGETGTYLVFGHSFGHVGPLRGGEVTSTAGLVRATRKVSSFLQLENGVAEKALLQLTPHKL